MPAYVDELSEVRASAAATIPFQISRHHPSFTCSYNFDQYLLSSSPPDFGYELWEKAQHPESNGSLYQFGSSDQLFGGSFMDSANKENKTKHENSTETGSQSSGYGRVKKVSFADDFGFRLTEIKYFFEKPDTPTVVKTRTMAQSVHILQPEQNLMSLPAKTAKSVSPRLVPDFSMPISNHVAFTEKIERDFVSLESLYVETDQSLIGTIRVKNVAFHKSVFVRYTFDAWKTSTDIACNYRPTLYPEVGNFFDSFSFLLNVPLDFPGRSAEFAICFQCDGKEYWDNNFGANYRLTNSDWSEPGANSPKRGFSWMSDNNWTHRSVSWPYW